MSYRVLFISSEFPPGPGGIANQAFNIVKYLNKDGYHVDVLTISDFMSNEEVKAFDEKLGFKVHRFSRFGSPVKNMMHRFSLTKSVFEQGKYDMAICSGRFSLWVGAWLKRKYGIKLMAITHGGDVVITNKLIRRVTHACLKRFDTVSSVSAYTASKLPQFPAGTQNRVVINNGIDLTEYEGTVISHRDMEGSPSLITVGNLWFRKGQQNIIAALPGLIKKYPDIHYHCVGLKSEEERINKQIEELNVEGHVTLHGRVSRDELLAMNKSSDVFMMLSVESTSGDFEGFGIAILEANILGTPAIGSLNSGIEDAIENGVNGYLVDPTNTRDVEEAVVRILNNKADLEKKSIEHAKSFSWDVIIKQYETELEKLLETPVNA